MATRPARSAGAHPGCRFIRGSLARHPAQYARPRRRGSDADRSRMPKLRSHAALPQQEGEIRYPLEVRRSAINGRGVFALAKLPARRKLGAISGREVRLPGAWREAEKSGKI